MISSITPYVSICGSYKVSRNIDKLCKHLGHEFAVSNFAIISGGGRPAIKISQSMDKTLNDLRKYDPHKIVTVYRRKIPAENIKVKRIGCTVFVGNDVHDVTDHIVGNAKVLIVIGGNANTKEEVLMALERKIPVIPVGMSGGTAAAVWERYQRSEHSFNKSAFSELNNPNYLLASKAVISILEQLMSHD